MNELTDAQCNQFRRHNGDFNSMVRAIFTAGCEQRQAGQEPAFIYQGEDVCGDPVGPPTAYYTAPQPAQADQAAEIAALKAIVASYIAYDEDDHEDSVRMMLDYAEMLAASRAVMAQGVQSS